jgi:glutamate-1-semialdehyde aminotransferase
LLSKTLRTAGKTVLIVVGAGFGLLRSLRVPGNITSNAAGLKTLEARVDTINVAVARLAGQTEQLQSKLDRMVTKDELTHTLDEVLGRIERGVDARFEHQTRSVEALRMMIGQTDELLQRVLDGLESMKAEGDTQASR